MKAFNNVKRHIKQHHPDYSLELFNNGVALTKNGEVITITPSSLEAHQALLEILGEYGKDDSLEALLSMPVVNNFGKRTRTGTSVPIVVYDYITEVSDSLGVGRGSFVLDCLRGYWPVVEVQERAEELSVVLRTKRFREMSIGLSLRSSRDLLIRVPRGLLASAVIACLEEERNERWF